MTYWEKISNGPVRFHFLKIKLTRTGKPDSRIHPIVYSRKNIVT